MTTSRIGRDDEAGTSLPGGLLLRTARPGDLDQIGDLLVDRGEAVDRLDHRLVVQSPDHGWPSCAVVVDGDRVVSTATLLAEEVLLGAAATTVRLPAGQVELVATLREYEGRGLVRALMRWAHDRSAARGDVLQLMIGIPYFYRLFGYAYAIDIAPRRVVNGVVGAQDELAVRAATVADLPSLRWLQDQAQAGSDVRVPHSPSRWEWILAHDASTTWVVTRRGVVLATGRTSAPDDGVLLAEVAAREAVAAETLVAHALELAAPHPLRVAERPGTMVSELVSELTAPGSPDCEQYYVRVPSLVGLLEAVRPVLSARLAASGLDRDGRDVVLSTFGEHVRFPVTDGALGAAVGGGPMQAPGSVGGCGVAPDQVGSLVFGPLGVKGLTRRQPDVYPGPDRGLFAALFPPVTSDLLLFYLP